MPATASLWSQYLRGACIAGKPAPTKTKPRVGAGLPAMVSLWCQYLRGVCIAGKPAPTEPAPAVGAGLARDGIGGVPVPSRCLYRRQACSNENQAACRSGLARDGIAGVSVPSRCLYRRQACSNRARASCRSRACPRWYRCGVSRFAVFVSQASLLQQSPRQL